MEMCSVYKTGGTNSVAIVDYFVALEVYKYRQ